MRDKMTKDTKKEKYIIITYFILQLIYVYAKGPCVSVSDEYTYKQIALDIFNGNAVSSFHYPFVYPFLLSFSFNFGDSFYYVMLLENILIKSMLLIVILNLKYLMFKMIHMFLLSLHIQKLK